MNPLLKQTVTRTKISIFIYKKNYKCYTSVIDICFVLANGEVGVVVSSAHLDDLILLLSTRIGRPIGIKNSLE